MLLHCEFPRALSSPCASHFKNIAKQGEPASRTPGCTKIRNKAKQKKLYVKNFINFLRLIETQQNTTLISKNYLLVFYTFFLLGVT